MWSCTEANPCIHFCITFSFLFSCSRNDNCTTQCHNPSLFLECLRFPLTQQKLHTPPGGLLGCIFCLHKRMSLWSGNLSDFHFLICTNHKKPKNLCFHTVFKLFRFIFCIEVSQNWKAIVLTLQTPEYIEDPYPICLMLLHFTNNSSV